MKSDAANTDVVPHLYVHFPFCARICPYCAFYKTRGSADDVAQFCRALALEAKRVLDTIPFALETIFFGGGTPTALSTAQLENLLATFRDGFDLSAVREWSIEANPGSVSEKKAAVLRRSGINRISLGVQSWDDELLHLLGREHNAEQARQSFHIFRSAGFDNISIDLMFALPGQTEAQWQASLEQSIALNPEHISTYCLTYEEDTEFLAQYQRGEFLVHDDDEARFFEIAMEMLQSAGYEQYEISNFARAGFTSLHNAAYWCGADYLGLGPSAFSTRAFHRWQNVADHREYARRLFAGESPVAATEELSDAMKRIERIALGLRTREGVPRNIIAKAGARDLISAGLLAQTVDRFILTRSGKLVADSVAEELL
jgi:oxygen-independent coproporphyrinogen III oxidase